MTNTLPAPTRGPKPSFDYAEATKRFIAGETLTVLAEDYGVSRQRMSQIVGSRRPKTDDQIAQEKRVVAARLAGKKLREIAADEGMTASAVCHILQRHRRGS